MDTPILITPCATLLWLDDVKILRSNYKLIANLPDGIQHIKMMKEFLLDLSIPLKVPVINDISNLTKHPPKEVREYFASDAPTEFASCSAVITGSGLSKIVGNIYLKFNKPVLTTKLFSSDKKAIEWLLEMTKTT